MARPKSRRVLNDSNTNIAGSIPARDVGISMLCSKDSAMGRLLKRDAP
jgi:hypothetical protein